ncbi:Ldh family oxidoreductase [Microlunatus panaciterrae]|uniref:LDH2 family malate/lactate/ureidoglycolate dehydrogenase n=1 Tax=Microlunatus panaciterrae TaxID=400768 RepID=A0ABS2RDY8_9ACTN|nr:Ldh family oxidoreductase [Microlunatus panaciterrae]MBM7797211.1 LDH2 family malate/lactate/ureidoglycolate dehydrogenase [Microlunatus panaciterrae]
MNVPPDSFVRVAADDLRAFARSLGLAAGLSEARASLLARLLTDNDLRGVFSHGTQQLATYAVLLRDGVLNAQPDVSVVRETSGSLLVDGDGGLGYFPAYDGTLQLIEKVKEHDIAVLVTRNHGHFGAAGLYSRLTLEHDLLSFVTSGHQLRLAPGDPIYEAAGGSPMSFSAPTLDEDPLVLDFGAMHDLYADSPFRDELAAKAPGLVHRAIGMGAVCQSWGGLLAGVPIDPARASHPFEGANQGAMVIAFKISLFAEPLEFKQEMDRYVRAVRELAPLTEGQQPFLPGGVEAARERAWTTEGIPVGEQHQHRLETVAEAFGLTVPWEGGSARA